MCDASTASPAFPVVKSKILYGYGFVTSALACVTAPLTSGQSQAVILAISSLN